MFAARTWLTFLVLLTTTHLEAQPTSQEERDYRTTILIEASGSQDYRLEIFSTGDAFYLGRARVATLGSRRLTFAPEKVDALANDLIKSGIFSEHPRLSFTTETGSRLLDVTVAVYRAGKSHSLTYQEGANPNINAIVFPAFERYAPTESLRCPFVQPLYGVSPGGDVCEARRRAFSATTRQDGTK
jgi:hypothetical protein